MNYSMGINNDVFVVLYINIGVLNGNFVAYVVFFLLGSGGGIGVIVG